MNPNLQEPKYLKRVISLLNDISVILRYEHDVQNVFRPILEIMAKYLGIHRGMITILNRKTGAISLEASIGLTEEEASRGIYSLGEGIIGKVAETAQPMIIPMTTSEPDFLDKTGSRAGLADTQISFICVPIMGAMGGQAIGTLSADRLFEDDVQLEDDQKLLTIIAAMVSRSVRLHQAIHEENLSLYKENERLQQELKGSIRQVNMIGTSSVMQNLFRQINRIGPNNTTVLIQGESGTGKELVAEAIHYHSRRADKPFIKFNCAVLPEHLIESELFGHNRGSFTGALQTHIGKFEQANGGTIFLDEIGEMTLNAQVKLLRVLQEKEYQRIGDTEVRKADVRVIAATNRDLEALAAEGTFREDLFYRLNVFPIYVPPLRERKTDIIPLSDFFIEKHSKFAGKQISRISTPAIDMLMSYHWPGNVRELENCIERGVILSDDDTIHGFHMPPSLQKSSHRPETGEKGTLTFRLDSIEYEMIVEELKRTNGNISKAARNLGITNRQLGLRIQKYQIQVARYSH